MNKTAKKIQAVELQQEPDADIATCSACGWSGAFDNLDTEQEGDFENGYHDVHLCPKCPDGGCIDNYSMSKEQDEAWGRLFEATRGVTTD